MKTLFAFILILIGYHVQGQSSIFDPFILDIETVNTKEELKKILHSKDHNSYKIEIVYLKLERNLDFDFKQSVFEIRVRFDKSKLAIFDFYSVFRNDSIVYGKVINEPNKVFETLKINKDLIKFYLVEHDRKYQQLFTLADFINAFNKIVIYGFNCGLAGGSYMTNTTEMVEKLVRQKSTKEISLLLRNINPEIRAFGYYGLLKLQDENISMSKQDQSIIKLLKNENGIIYSCSGCDLINTNFKEIKFEYKRGKRDKTKRSSKQAEREYNRLIKNQ